MFFIRSGKVFASVTITNLVFVFSRKRLSVRANIRSNTVRALLSAISTAASPAVLVSNTGPVRRVRETKSSAFRTVCLCLWDFSSSRIPKSISVPPTTSGSGFVGTCGATGFCTGIEPRRASSAKVFSALTAASLISVSVTPSVFSASIATAWAFVPANFGLVAMTITSYS